MSAALGLYVDQLEALHQAKQKLAITTANAKRLVAAPVGEEVHSPQDILGVEADDTLSHSILEMKRAWIANCRPGGVTHHFVHGIRGLVCQPLKAWREEIDELHQAVQTVQKAGATHQYYVQKVRALEDKRQNAPDAAKLNPKIDRNVKKLSEAAEDYHTQLASVSECVDEVLSEANERLEGVLGSFAAVNTMIAAKTFADARRIAKSSSGRAFSDGLEEANDGISKLLLERVHFEANCRKRNFLGIAASPLYAVVLGGKLQLHESRTSWNRGDAPEFTLLVDGAEFWGKDDSHAVRVTGVPDRMEAGKDDTEAVLLFDDSDTAEKACRSLLQASEWKRAGASGDLLCKVNETMAAFDLSRDAGEIGSAAQESPATRSGSARVPEGPLFQGGVASRVALAKTKTHDGAVDRPASNPFAPPARRNELEGSAEKARPRSPAEEAVLSPATASGAEGPAANAKCLGEESQAQGPMDSPEDRSVASTRESRRRFGGRMSQAGPKGAGSQEEASEGSRGTSGQQGRKFAGGVFGAARSPTQLSSPDTRSPSTNPFAKQ